MLLALLLAFYNTVIKRNFFIFFKALTIIIIRLNIDGKTIRILALVVPVYVWSRAVHLQSKGWWF